MKRHIVAALVIGVIVAGLIIGLEIAGLLAGADEAVSHLFPDTAKRLMPAVGYGLVVIVAMGVAFLTLSISHRNKTLLIIGILLVELLGVAWVCSLYKLEFQPLPAIAAALLGFLGAIAAAIGLNANSSALDQNASFSVTISPGIGGANTTFCG